MVAVKGKHSKSVVGWSRLKRSGLFVRVENAKEVEKIENVLSRLGVSPQCSVSRLEVFTSLGKKNHIEVSYKQLKKIARGLGRRGALV